MSYDAVVIGAGPNGLAAAIELARNGYSVCIIEAADRVGGGARSAEWTLPGFIHDTCSAIHPLACSSPFFKQLPLAAHGLSWVVPEAAVAHPLGGGEAVLLERSVGDTAKNLEGDAIRYARLMVGFVRQWEHLADDLLAPIHLPRSPLLTGRFAWHGIRAASAFARAHFRGERAQALFAGLAGHSVLPLQRRGTTAFGLLLGVLGHVNGWPFARGGSQTLSNALSSCFTALGGTIETGVRINSLAELPAARWIFCDVTVREFLRIAGARLPEWYRRKLMRFRFGPGVFKLDWALSRPIPWRAEICARAATVHVGGSLEEIGGAEAEVGNGRIPERPFIILAQQSLFDSSRAPAGMHTAWGYCHVPNGCEIDMTESIENQLERFAPGFRDCVLARHRTSPREMENYNPNYAGGDISGGATDLAQILCRPVFSPRPYAAPVAGLFLCSSSTPPGGGVHGMCGYHAARAALRSQRQSRLEL
jgi:phytoene dehydrogenase-like protein